MSTTYETISLSTWKSIVESAPAVGEDSPLSMRQETRWFVQTGTVELCYHDPHDNVRNVNARIQNVSDQGMMVRTEAAITPNTPVLMRIELQGETCLLCGIIRHCSMTVGGFKIGVRLLFDDEAILYFG